VVKLPPGASVASASLKLHHRPVDHNVCAVTGGDATHAVTQVLARGINDSLESERLCLLGFRMVGRA